METISEVLGKRGRVHGIIILIFNMTYWLLAIYLLRFYDGNILDNTIGYIGTPDLHDLG